MKEVARLRRLRAEYEQLQVTLRDLPSRVEHDVMVPLCKNAFMPGKLRHTNEILVLLGDNIFAERSASQAAEIAARRVAHVERKLSAAEHEAAMLEQKHGKALNVQLAAEEQMNEDLVDIREPYESEEDEPPSATDEAPTARAGPAPAEESCSSGPPRSAAPAAGGARVSFGADVAHGPPPEPSPQAPATRPISKFKAERMARR